MAKENPNRLKAAGPIDPENGFPLWFEDETGLRLELGINRDPINPDPLLPAIGDLQKPADWLQFPDNFPDESFYFLAEAELQVGANGAGGRARVILALEAAFGGAGDPQAGLNVVFARIRVRMDDLIPGLEYKVIHPYGEIDGELMKADDRGRVFYTQDLGIVEGDGTAVIGSGQVAPFLVGTTIAPPGYIGDGVTPQRVTGSPIIPSSTNLVTIEWSPINPITNLPDSPQRVSTNLFSVQGRTATRVGAWLDSATYEIANGNFFLTVQARSDANQDLRLVGTGVHFKLDGEGEFYTGLVQVASLPNDARLVNASDTPPTSYPIKDFTDRGVFTDRVIVESAIHDRVTGTLTIKAKSSDPSAVLKLPQFNDRVLTPTSDSFPAGVAVPAEIIVESDKEGEGRQWVEVKNNPTSNGSVKAIAIPPTVAFADETVTIDGSASLDATSFVWSQKNVPPNPSVNPNSAITPQFTFTPPAAGDYTFNLSVGGNGASSDNTDITVTVRPKRGIDTLRNIRAEYRIANGQLRVSGTVSQVPNVVRVSFNNQEVGRAAADITGAWSVRAVLLASPTQPVPGLGDRVQVNSSLSPQDADENKANIRIK